MASLGLHYLWLEAIRIIPFAVRRSPFAVRRSPFAVRRSPFAVVDDARVSFDI